MIGWNSLTSEFADHIKLGRERREWLIAWRTGQLFIQNGLSHGGADRLEDHKYNKDKYLVLHLERQVHQYSLGT